MEPRVAPPGDDKNTGSVQEAVGGLFLSTAFVLVSLRLYVRARMVKLWWDDFFLLLGLLISIADFYLAIASINSGFGRHVYYLSSKQIFNIVKLQNLSLPFYMSSLTSTKLSICLFLLRIFTTNRVWRRAMYIIIALIVFTSLSSIILTFPSCKPSANAKVWDPTKSICSPAKTQTASFYYHGGVSIFTDFLLAFLPFYFLKNIQISLRTKLSICALMSLGVFTGICAIIRTTWTAQLYSSDLTYVRTNYIIWAGLEMTVAMIAAAIPALRPLWLKSARSTNRIRKSIGQVRRPNNQQRGNSSYVMTDQQTGADSLPSRPKACITAPQQGKIQVHVGSEATAPPDCNGIMKTSHISTEIFRKCEEGQWIPEHSSFSHEERRVEDVV